jgi:hypothetical protein
MCQICLVSGEDICMLSLKIMKMQSVTGNFRCSVLDVKRDVKREFDLVRA